MTSPQANALPRWDHLKLGRVYTVHLLTGQHYVGTLVDAAIFTTPGGYPSAVMLALEVGETSPPVNVPLTAVAGIEPMELAGA